MHGSCFIGRRLKFWIVFFMVRSAWVEQRQPNIVRQLHREVASKAAGLVETCELLNVGFRLFR